MCVLLYLLDNDNDESGERHQMSKNELWKIAIPGVLLSDPAIAPIFPSTFCSPSGHKTSQPILWVQIHQLCFVRNISFRLGAGS